MPKVVTTAIEVLHLNGADRPRAVRDVYEARPEDVTLELGALVLRRRGPLPGELSVVMFAPGEWLRVQVIRTAEDRDDE